MEKGNLQELIHSKKPRPIKIVVMGERETGKTTLIRSLINKSFYPHSKPTILIQYHVFQINQSQWIQFWDCGGQEHFKNSELISQFCSGASFVLLCFDLTDSSSLYALAEWNMYFSKSIPRVLVGTRADLASEEELSRDLVPFQSRWDCKNVYKCSNKDVSALQEIIVNSLNYLKGDNDVFVQR